MKVNLLLLCGSFLCRFLCRGFFRCHRDLLVIRAAKKVETRATRRCSRGFSISLATRGCLREPLQRTIEP